jgi:F-type H+-transporting ATPase subunit delta
MQVTRRCPTSSLRARPASVRTTSRTSKLVVQARREDVSNAYAKALLETADEKNTLEAVHADMDAIAGLIKDNVALTELLYSPVVDIEKKKAVIAKIGKEAQFQKYTMNFLNLLIQKDRLNKLDEICESFEDGYCKLTDTQVAVVRSAVKLEQEQQFLIAKKLQELTGSKNIKLKPLIDTSLIAGFVIEYGSSQIDMSVRGQIERVTVALTGAMELKMV